MNRVAKAAGSWDDLLRRGHAPEEHREPSIGTWRKTCAELQQHQGTMRVWERRFILDLTSIADQVLGERPA
jgi:hypothetical protein